MEWFMLAVVIAFGIYGLFCPESHLTPGFLLSFIVLIFIWLGMSG